MKNLCRKDKRLWRLIRAEAIAAAAAFDLPMQRIEPTRRREVESIFGFCSRSGIVWVTLRGLRKRGGWRRKPELAYAIVDTVAHELAHLRHNNHRNKWFKLYAVILLFLANRGTYTKVRKYAR